MATGLFRAHKPVNTTAQQHKALCENVQWLLWKGDATCRIWTDGLKQVATTGGLWSESRTADLQNGVSLDFSYRMSLFSETNCYVSVGMSILFQLSQQFISHTAMFPANTRTDVATCWLLADRALLCRHAMGMFANSTASIGILKHV